VVTSAGPDGKFGTADDIRYLERMLTTFRSMWWQQTEPDQATDLTWRLQRQVFVTFPAGMGKGGAFGKGGAPAAAKGKAKGGGAGGGGDDLGFQVVPEIRKA